MPPAKAPARPARPDAVAAPAAPEAVIPSRGGEPPPPQLSAKELQLGALKRLVSPHTEGATLGMARLVSISGVRLGAASLIFKTRLGVSFQVDICKRDSGRGSHKPIASTGKYDLFVVNGGKGYTPTNHQLERTVDQLARTINANEARAPRLRVLTLRKRLRQHPRGKFNTLQEAKPIRGRM